MKQASCSSTDHGGGKRRAVTVSHRAVWPGPADMGPTRMNRTHNNRRVLALGEHRIFYSHRKFGRHSTASVQWPRVRSAASDDHARLAPRRARAAGSGENPVEFTWRPMPIDIHFPMGTGCHVKIRALAGGGFEGANRFPCCPRGGSRVYTIVR